MNEYTLLLRQVNPAWVQAGRITSQTFRPTPKDESMLSVYDGDRIAPGKAWEHFTGVLGRRSVGVLAVSVPECSAQDLAVRPDPEHFPEHALIDFSRLDKSEVERKAKHLRAHAEVRGWLHRAE